MTVTSTLYIGIDVSLDTNQVCAMNLSFSINHSEILLKTPTR